MTPEGLNAIRMREVCEPFKACVGRGESNDVKRVAG